MAPDKSSLALNIFVVSNHAAQSNILPMWQHLLWGGVGRHVSQVLGQGANMNNEAKRMKPLNGDSLLCVL